MSWTFARLHISSSHPPRTNHRREVSAGMHAATTPEDWPGGTHSWTWIEPSQTSTKAASVHVSLVASSESPAGLQLPPRLQFSQTHSRTANVTNPCFAVPSIKHSSQLDLFLILDSSSDAPHPHILRAISRPLVPAVLAPVNSKLHYRISSAPPGVTALPKH